jgi:hypothetical protein
LAHEAACVGLRNKNNRQKCAGFFTRAGNGCIIRRFRALWGGLWQAAMVAGSVSAALFRQRLTEGNLDWRGTRRSMSPHLAIYERVILVFFSKTFFYC